MPRRVLFLHSSAGLYGADLELLGLARGLDRRRYEPAVVLPERGRLASLLEEAQVPVQIAPLAILRRGLLSPRGAVQLAARVARDRHVVGAHAARLGAAIVHSNTSVVLGGRAIAARAGAVNVVHVREIYAGAAGGGAGERLWPLLRRRLLHSDALLCVSAAVAAQFAPSPRAVVVHGGVVRVPEPAPRHEARAALGLPADRFVVALLGRVSDWKGQDVLARALAEAPLAELGAIGLVAGDVVPGGEEVKRALGALGEHLGLGDRLRLLGFRDDVETVLGAADAVAVPSTRPDPLPNSALEAAAGGLPLVASAHGGLPEIVREGVTGRLVAPGDPLALATALRALADDPAGARRMGRAGAEDSRRRFNLDRTLAEVQDLYDRLLVGEAPRQAETARFRSLGRRRDRE